MDCPGTSGKEDLGATATATASSNLRITSNSHSPCIRVNISLEDNSSSRQQFLNGLNDISHITVVKGLGQCWRPGGNSSYYDVT